MELAIETLELTRRFGSRTAVDHLNLRVRKGTIHGFLGPNGAGKSTTIKILAGLLRADGGEARILGEMVGTDNPRARQKIGYMPELPKFPKYLSGRELLELYGRMYGIGKAQLREMVPRLLGMVGLKGREDSKIGEYSKGMQQRFGLAQALLDDPEVVILDEPTVGLDPVGMVEFRDIVRSVARKGATVFLSSHLLFEVQQVCDEVTIIDHGVSLASGSPQELSSRLGKKATLELEVLNLTDVMVEEIRKMPSVEGAAREGAKLTIKLSTADDARPQISRQVSAMGGVIVGMIQTGAGLEELFMQLVSDSEKGEAR